MAHRVIGRLLEAGIRNPSPEQILSAAAREPLLQERHVYRLAARQRLVAATAIYFSRFLPAFPPWAFLDYAVAVDGTDLDLVFDHQDRRVRSDELKTGGAPGLVDRKRLDEQIAQQLVAGVRTYGERYDGIRVLFLGAPRSSFRVAIDDTRTPLFSEVSDDAPTD
jgi:hypothetical protein